MSHSERNIFLIGPMGSGKTTIGRIVAQDLGLEFHDCDHALEKLTGASVSLIFDVEGESGFREREAQLLSRLAGMNGVLVATGGGVVTRKENRQLLQCSGLVVWLDTTVDQQIKRLSQDKSRPLLQAKDRVAGLEKLARERNPLYRDLADLVFQSPDRNPRTAAGALTDLIREHAQANFSGTTHAGR